MAKKAVVTGASRGIGLEFVKQLLEQEFDVIACCRQPESATELLALKQKNANLKLMPLDVTQESSIKQLAVALKGQPIDWLINNAGIAGEAGVTVGNIDAKNFLNVLHTNCIGAVQVADALLNNLVASTDKLVINITSRMGSISDNTSGRSYAYRASKAALNAVMRSFAIDVEPLDVKVMLFHPGWVQTDMGGANAEISAENSVRGMLAVIDNQHHNGHANTIWRFDGGEVAW